MSDNEKKLVKRILSGDEKAFEELFDALHSQVYNICLGFMKNPQDAKDMAQETFIKIYQKLHTFRFQCSLTTWIYSICASTCLDALRRQQRLITGELKESDATSTHVPEDALLLDELLEHIVHEIDKNNEKTANVLKRRLFAQESYEKISSVEKIPVSSARTYFTRGRRRLMRSIQEFFK